MASTSPRRKQQRLPAAYYRGGTSRAVIFKAQDLPQDRGQWAAIFRGVIGSPDPYGRQLDGLGGGVSSLSKVCVVGPSSIGAAADVDYTFAAVGVTDDDVDYSSNCGNMSAAIGPFAVDSGLVAVAVPADGRERGAVTVTVTMHNTNTGKLIRATFPVGGGGEAAAGGDFAIAGVAGSGAPVRLDFVRPGGSKTGKLLPTGRLVDVWDADSGVEMTCIDAGNPCVFVEAGALVSRIPAGFSPKDIEGDRPLMAKLDAIRRHAAVKMGVAADEGDVPGSIPKMAMVWTPRAQLSEPGDVCVRALSVGQPHKAVPVTVGLALAAAAQLPGTVVHRAVRAGKGKGIKGGTGSLEMAHPTGLFRVDATYDGDGGLASAAVYRTARRLMEGTVFFKVERQTRMGSR